MNLIDFAPHDLTSYTSHSPFVASNSGSDATFEAWRAFDSQYDIYHNSAGHDGGAYWLKLDIGAVNTKLLYSYSIRVNDYPEPNRAPKNWTMEGSNDNSAWDVLDTVTNETTWGTGEVRNYICDTYTTKYRYFRLNITANNGDASFTQVAELYLYYDFIFEYVGQTILTLTPQSSYTGPHAYVGHALLRLTPIATTELFDPGVPDVIPASTGGWTLGGAGVWGGSTPTSTDLSEFADLDPTGYYLAGGAEVISTIPAAEVIAAEVAFVFCGPGATGNATTSEPAQDVIEDVVALALGGAGVWGQVAPADIPNIALVGSGGFVLSGSGFSLDPGVTPTATVIVSTGGWVLGGVRQDETEITYPTSLDRVIISSGGWELGGNEGGLESAIPAATVIVSNGAIFAMGGAGLATTRPPPIAVITGDVLGGFVLSGSGFALAAEVYEAWVLSGQAFEPSVWSGFNFNSFAVKGGQAYACGDAGIYLLGGDHDAGEPIQSGARVGPVNFGGAGTKRLRGVVFGQGGTSTRVRVRTDEAEGVFAPDRDTDRVTVSRDLQASEFTVDILNFEELSHLEIFPLRLARR